MHGPGLVLEEERRRVFEAADPEASLDQPHRPVRAGERPVALAHVAHQERVAREVHRVHLGELRRPEQRLRRRHQRGGHRVALGRVGESLRHQARGGREREALEAPVLGDRAEVRRVRAVPALAQDPLEPDLHARVILALAARQSRIDLEAAVLVFEQLRHGVGLDLGGGAMERARRERVDPRAERGEQGVHVDADVAHAVHRVAEDRRP